MWDFKKLRAWKMSRELIGDVYRITDRFPASEKFGLTAQLRRAANSIGANLAEAAARTSNLDRARFLSYAIASADETEHHLIISNDIGILDMQVASGLITKVDDVRRTTKGLYQKCLRDR